jgi:predicted nuclease of restriction endonuclease-like (RecB) superfamily
MDKNQLSATNEYRQFLIEVKERVRTAQYAALKTVNSELVGLYWDIGKMIVQRQNNADHGAAIAEQLSKDLQAEFPGIGGFSRRNLFYMREFFLIYRDDERVQPLVAQIGWTHNLAIFQRCKEPLQREFYIRMTRKYGWSKNVLIHQIENQTYEKSLLGQSNFDKALTPELRAQAKLAVKDEYTFDFLELGDAYSERELEKALIAKVEHFLREMGGLYAYIGSQYRLDIGDKVFFIDLLLFHRRLKSLLAIDLKIGEFQPEHVGKMQFYLTVLDEKVRMEGENSSIGIILCKEKNRTIVEYALRETGKPVGVAAYTTSKTLPQNLKGELPSPEEISRLMEDL